MDREKENCIFIWQLPLVFFINIHPTLVPIIWFWDWIFLCSFFTFHLNIFFLVRLFPLLFGLFLIIILHCFYSTILFLGAISLSRCISSISLLWSLAHNHWLAWRLQPYQLLWPPLIAIKAYVRICLLSICKQSSHWLKNIMATNCSAAAHDKKMHTIISWKYIQQIINPWKYPKFWGLQNFQMGQKKYREKHCSLSSLIVFKSNVGNLRKLIATAQHYIKRHQRHVPKFCYFWNSFKIYIIKNHINDTWMVMFRIKDIQTFEWVYGYGLKIHSQIWVSFFEWLYIIISYTYSSNLLFQKNAKKIN